MPPHRQTDWDQREKTTMYLYVHRLFLLFKKRQKAKLNQGLSVFSLLVFCVGLFGGPGRVPFPERGCENEMEKASLYQETELPLARIKKIMKMEDEIQSQLGGKKCMVASETPVVFAKACELFILELTTRAWSLTEESRRRTLQRCDVAAAVSQDEVFDFLIDVVPREIAVHEIAKKNNEDQDLIKAWQRRVAQHVFRQQALVATPPSPQTQQQPPSNKKPRLA